MARMHNSTDYVKFLEKSLAPFFRKVSKTSFFGHFLCFFCQNDANYVKSKKSARIGFLVPYLVPSFGKIVGAVSEQLP